MASDLQELERGEVPPVAEKFKTASLGASVDPQQPVLPLPPTPSIISPLNPPASKNTVITGVLQLSAKRSRQVTEKTQFSNWKSEGYNHIDVTGYVDGRRSFLWK